MFMTSSEKWSRVLLLLGLETTTLVFLLSRGGVRFDVSRQCCLSVVQNIERHVEALFHEVQRGGLDLITGLRIQVFGERLQDVTDVSRHGPCSRRIQQMHTRKQFKEPTDCLVLLQELSFDRFEFEAIRMHSTRGELETCHLPCGKRIRVWQMCDDFIGTLVATRGRVTKPRDLPANFLFGRFDRPEVLPHLFGLLLLLLRRVTTGAAASSGEYEKQKESTLSHLTTTQKKNTWWCV